MRRVIAAALAIMVLSSSPRTASAAPDPTIASLLSAGSTLVPLGITAALLLTGPGKDEDVRFDLALFTMATGSIVGPSIGQIYASGGVDAVVTFILRMLTGALMVTGTGLALRSGNAQDAGVALAVLGAVPTLFLAAWDVFGAASSAKAARYAEGHAPGESRLMLKGAVPSCRDGDPLTP
jgi:hypothetical protein